MRLRCGGQKSIFDYEYQIVHHRSWPNFFFISLVHTVNSKRQMNWLTLYHADTFCPSCSAREREEKFKNICEIQLKLFCVKLIENIQLCRCRRASTIRCREIDMFVNGRAWAVQKLFQLKTHWTDNKQGSGWMENASTFFRRPPTPRTTVKHQICLSFKSIFLFRI